MPRYAGPPVKRIQALDRAVGRKLDRGDAAALDELWRALVTTSCLRCGADLRQQLQDAEQPSITAVAEPVNSRRFGKLDILDSDFLATADHETLLDSLLEAALDRTATHATNAQLADPRRRGIYIAAHRGFERPFLDFFEWVSGDEGSACATAAAEGTTVMVPNVMRSPLFTDASKQVMFDSKSYAVLSIPMLSSTKELLGVFSCHYHKAGWPGEDVPPLLSAIAKAAAWSLQRQTPLDGKGS